LTGYAAIANIATSDDIASCKPEQGLKWGEITAK
jgi:hypothetical protein